MPNEIFKENVFIITGASSGIGEELAQQLAEQGAWLTLAARKAGKLQKVAEECIQRGSSDPSFGEWELSYHIPRCYRVTNYGLRLDQNLLPAAKYILESIAYIYIDIKYILLQNENRNVAPQ